MIHSIRIEDVPIFVLTLVIFVPLGLGFISLFEHEIIDIPWWMFPVILLAIGGLSTFLASVIWKKIQRALGLS